MFDLLTASELAEVLKVPPSKITAMANRGELPFVRVCGRLRFDAVEVEGWLKANRPMNGSAEMPNLVLHGKPAITPRAIVEWPNGLGALPAIYAVAETLEASNQIESFLRSALTVSKPTCANSHSESP
jgi:excisionase family DNA binding protein